MRRKKRGRERRVMRWRGGEKRRRGKGRREERRKERRGKAEREDEERGEERRGRKEEDRRRKERGRVGRRKGPWFTGEFLTTTLPYTLGERCEDSVGKAEVKEEDK